ncbi:prepilin peptidase [Henriciella algicola]|uniref:Prepilin peptidase n=1 Tax=Henriciella algicola TaxID=1608422 RepID=A0A399RAV6_9PROT|nr:A24 family peptidase [Henriciella algicola]RIJ28676.1 prepilin peptidase [Henriciella algicola]
MGWPMTRALPLFIHGLLAAGIGVTAWLFAPPGILLLTLAMGAVLLALASTDWRTFILPDPLNALLALLGLLMVWQHARSDWLDHLIGGAAAYLALLGIELFYRHVRGIDALGRGDAKLAGALGLWLGWQGLPFLFLIAAASGLIGVLIYSGLLRRKITGDTPVPFGPWIALSGWICWLGLAAI